MNVVFKELHLKDFNDHLLDDFKRQQMTKLVHSYEDGISKIKETYFEDDWDIEKKLTIIEQLKNTVLDNGAVFVACIDEKLVGFASIEGIYRGSRNQYLNLPFFHVSMEYRNQKIGQKMFQSLVEWAKKRSAKKIYISSHPSLETQYFYKKVGCVYAKEIIPELFNKEPLDIQLEYVL